MKKTRSYKQVKFSPEKLKEGIDKWTEKIPEKEKIEVVSRIIYF